jgi:hypothetical protein
MPSDGGTEGGASQLCDPGLAGEERRDASCDAGLDYTDYSCTPLPPLCRDDPDGGLPSPTQPDSGQPDGGQPDGGQPDTGSSATAVDGVVTCLGLACDVATGETCCVANVPGFPDVPDPSDFSCTASPVSCDFSLGCDGDGDCTAGQLCCLDNLSGVSECRSDCGGSVHIECSHPVECPQGTVCCGQLNDPGPYAGVSCQSTCTDDLQRIFCASDLDCTAPATCRESALLPGRTVCRGPGQ